MARLRSFSSALRNRKAFAVVARAGRRFLSRLIVSCSRSDYYFSWVSHAIIDQSSFRLAAETSRLAACAPQNEITPLRKLRLLAPRILSSFPAFLLQELLLRRCLVRRRTCARPPLSSWNKSGVRTCCRSVRSLLLLEARFDEADAHQLPLLLRRPARLCRLIPVGHSS